MFAWLRVLVLSIVLTLGLAPAPAGAAVMAGCGESHGQAMDHAVMHDGHHGQDTQPQSGKTPAQAMPDCCTCCLQATTPLVPTFGLHRPVLAVFIPVSPTEMVGIAPEPVPPPPKVRA
ncbi:hypothetical protein [Chthonobacter albigriseus]|uniref:hypothetical protein n=1 Tax=Chthonobacter albigriseus TaxID=1683161 RepID=UPI0015EF32DC|nr:hypothetical protein [Chthonobacter albigriseus]